MTEKYIIAGQLMLILALIAFALGRSLGYSEGREAIASFLAQYRCAEFTLTPTGLECSLFSKRRAHADTN